jgi:predicted ATPase/class 3 adenylate cyclase
LDTTSLPTGTVTFLFTDIEGSTRLWEQHPQAMEAALTRHDALAIQVLAQHGGTLVKHRGEGDSLFAVFPRALDAVAAAAALQQAFCSEPWPEQILLRVRMAMHTGGAAVRDGDYYGAAVNRCARLRAAAHGGQVLLSQTTVDLVRDELPLPLTLRDLGNHRLRDLQRPEHIHQLLHPDLPGGFPPLRSLDALSHNLPLQLTSFIGREQEIAETKRRLSSNRLLTLTGAGGSGKSRLSLQVAAEVMEQYPDGVYFVELAPLFDPGLVPEAVAAALSIYERQGVPQRQALIEHLQSRRLLLILDNCEHLLPACAQLAETLLRECERLTILATSRERLGITGEALYPVPTLSLPDRKQIDALGAELAPFLSRYEAIRLFVDRAMAVSPEFAVTAGNAPAVVEVCRRLDGIPLAIELAAARVRALPVEQIAPRLEDRFRLLTGGSRTALPRQQTLRALIDWSYDLLSEPERIVLRRLSVFAGGWTLEAAEAVCSGGSVEGWEVLDLLTSLLDKSLLLYETRVGEARYRLLETIREYARAPLREAGEEVDVQGQHLAYFLAFAREAEVKLGGPEQAKWLDQIECEHDNLRAALQWCEVSAERAEAALQLVSATRLFWQLRLHRREGLDWLEWALERASREPSVTRAKALQATMLLLGQSDGSSEQMQRLLQEAAACWQELGDTASLAQGLVASGSLEDAVLVAQEAGDKALQAFLLGELSIQRRDRRDWSGMQAAAEQALILNQELGNTMGIANAFRQLGRAALVQGDTARARLMFSEHQERVRLLGDVEGVAIGSGHLAEVALMEGDYPQARAFILERLTLGQQVGRVYHIIESLERLGVLAAKQQQPERAARLFGAVEALCRSMGRTNDFQPWSHVVPRQPSLDAARLALGEAAFAAAWEEGQRMSLEEAVAYALQDDTSG